MVVEEEEVAMMVEDDEVDTAVAVAVAVAVAGGIVVEAFWFLCNSCEEALAN